MQEVVGIVCRQDHVKNFVHINIAYMFDALMRLCVQAGLRPENGDTPGYLHVYKRRRLTWICLIDKGSQKNC